MIGEGWARSIEECRLSRNAHVDRLRGISILVVLAGHSLRYGGFWAESFPTWFREQIITSAIYGVTIFFVISGFLINGKFVRSDSDMIDIDLRNFYLQRIGRIVPPLLLLVSVSLVIALALGQPFDLGKIARGFTCLLQLDFNAAARLIPHTESSYDPLWSLAIEEQFYVILPLLCLMVTRKHRLIFILTLFVVFGLLYRTKYSYSYAFFGTFDQIAIGGLAAILGPKLAVRVSAPTMIGLRIVGLAGLAILYATTSYMHPAYLSLVALCAAAYIAGSIRPASEGRLALRPLESIGIFSYEIYLFHFIVLWPLAPISLYVRSPDYFGVRNWLMMFGTLAIIYVLGLAIARFYSEPLNRLIRRRFGTTFGGTRISDFVPSSGQVAAVAGVE